MRTYEIFTLTIAILVLLTNVFKVPLERLWAHIFANQQSIGKSLGRALYALFFIIAPGIMMGWYWNLPFSKDSVFYLVISTGVLVYGLVMKVLLKIVRVLDVMLGIKDDKDKVSTK